MKDSAVSTVLSTILLFGIVVLAAGTFAVFAAGDITNKAESIPYVMFQESESEDYLYHAGGDSLLKDEIRIYAKSSDITDKTTIDKKSWDIWQTGD
ncbi:MAG TPA: type IV pilin N-terminal domain-containing protein, partial [Methanocorpusculum sp.]|nr:type IV pilin N-terminal domain-containing protein [Methanocorpusculum sp.]